MAGGIPLWLDICNSNDIGANTSTSAGVVVTPSATADTKGSYTPLVASTPNDTQFIVVNVIEPDNAGTVTLQFAVDIAIGAGGSEQVIINNLLIPQEGHRQQGLSYGFPISIPAGTRIAARCQSANTSAGTLQVAATLYDSGLAIPEGYSGVDSVGFVAATTLGTAVTANATTVNVKGAFTQLVASSAKDYAGFMIYIDSQNETVITPNNTAGLLDIAVGAGGSEKIIVSNYSFVYASSGLTWPFLSPLLPIGIPAGTRISARWQSSSTDATAITAGITLYALYQ